MPDWKPCPNCDQRLDESKKDFSKQEHTAGLKRIELVNQSKDDPLPGNWSSITNHICTTCGLSWTRAEDQLGALMQYESSFTANPTDEQKPFILNRL